MFESDADRLTLIQAVGEQFDTGRPTKLWCIYDREYEEVSPGRGSFVSGKAQIACRTSDVAFHELVKQSKLTRADGSVWLVKGFEPDGTGMTVVTLSS